MARRRTLPGGIAVEQIAAALAAITTARVTIRSTVTVKGRDTEVLGDGLVDFSREIGVTNLVVDGRQVEQLTVGQGRFRRLPEKRQQETGKVWLWSPADDGYWDHMIAAMPYIASCTGSSAEMLLGEAVHRYSLVLKPRRPSLLTGLGRKNEPSVAALYAALQAHGRDRVFLDVWLAGDHTLRQARERSTAPESALLGREKVAAATVEYWDFGVNVDLAPPPVEQVFGYPAEQH
jgi:hypothetical protein